MRKTHNSDFWPLHAPTSSRAPPTQICTHSQSQIIVQFNPVQQESELVWGSRLFSEMICWVPHAFSGFDLCPPPLLLSLLLFGKRFVWDKFLLYSPGWLRTPNPPALRTGKAINHFPSFLSGGIPALCAFIVPCLLLLMPQSFLCLFSLYFLCGCLQTPGVRPFPQACFLPAPASDRNLLLASKPPFPLSWSFGHKNAVTSMVKCQDDGIRPEGLSPAINAYSADTMNSLNKDS